MKVNLRKVNWISVEDKNGKIIQIKPRNVELRTQYGEKFLHIKE